MARRGSYGLITPAAGDYISMTQDGAGTPSTKNAEFAAFAAEVNAIGWYDFGAFHPGTPANDEVVMVWPVVRDVLIPADCAGSGGSVETNPGASQDYLLKDDGTTIATITISTGGVVSFVTTSNTAKSVAAGSKLTLVAPASADGTLVGVAVTILATGE
jgi:hypothetical protein